MIKRLLFIALSFGLFQSVFSQVRPENNPKAPKISFNKTVHDFGKLTQNIPANCEFKFYNKGKSPLIVSNVSASCGCTVPSWSKAPLMPGDSGIIRVRYAASDSGVFDKLITVFSNATQIPLSLKIKGNVSPK